MRTHHAEPAPRATGTGARLASTASVSPHPGHCQTDTAVLVAGLSKRYGTIDAVQDVSFTVQRGETVALLGPNGAGKTTTLEILEGFRSRDAGCTEVLGCDPADRAASRDLRERVGLVLQDVAVEPYLTVRETLARSAGYYAAPRPVPELISLVGLSGLERRKVRNLSGGQKRRLDLALGLVGDPELLFLDEPTTGFDPGARHAAWEIVRGLTAAGTTIVLSTHYMEEAQALADRVLVLAGGRLVADSPPATLGGRNAEMARISFALPAGYSAGDLPASPLATASPAPGGLVSIATSAPTQTLYWLTEWALRQDVELDRLTVQRPSLEEIYLRLTSHADEIRVPERSMS